MLEAERLHCPFPLPAKATAALYIVFIKKMEGALRMCKVHYETKKRMCKVQKQRHFLHTNPSKQIPLTAVEYGSVYIIRKHITTSSASEKMSDSCESNLQVAHTEMCERLTRLQSYMFSCCFSK